MIGGVGGVVTSWAGRSHRRKLQDVRSELEGVLDRLEMGESLEPPPPSWKKWVERQFHGARRLMEDYGGVPSDDDFDDLGRGP
jgi:ribosome assembly protein YihI (activator of Der GTPase)